MTEDQVIVGLEVHCQLDTKSKLFCGCSTDYRNDAPNTHVCPVCLGLPGAMPVLNKRSIEYAMRVAKALNCSVLHESEFSRKNYFYPDLDKAYQITQYDKPLAEGGYLEIEGDEGGEKRIRLTRIHVEEDPGRLVHRGTTDRGKYSLVDYNRAGIPLIEIVSEPDMRSPKEARKFLNKLRATLEYLSVFDSEKEGSLRVDANISIRGNERVEVKNISSYKGVEKALLFEITRQKSLLRRGQKVDRETRHFLEARGVTQSSRSKEQEHDYRYFPEPDLRPLHVQSWVDGIVLPELPDARRERFIAQYGCSLNHARTLTGDLRLANFYEAVVVPDPANLAALADTWISDTLIGELNYRDMTVEDVNIGGFNELLELVRGNKCTDKGGIEILRMMLDNKKQGRTYETPSEIMDRLNLRKVSDTITMEMAYEVSAQSGVESDLTIQSNPILTAIAEVLTEHPAAVEDFRKGKKGAFNFLIGQLMKKTRGCADPVELNRLLTEELKKKEV
jgi:aspartyl-tRNA(Asn)/glutamyl-tRNA(Gln) amidotransferase subunit B